MTSNNENTITYREAADREYGTSEDISRRAELRAVFERAGLI